MNWYEQWKILSPIEKLKRALKHLEENEIEQAKDIINDILEAENFLQSDVIKSLRLCDCGYSADENNICTGCKLEKP